MEHRFRAAPDDRAGRAVLGQELGDEAFEPDGTVVGRQLDVAAGGADILDPGGEGGRADSVVEGHSTRAAAWWAAAVPARAQQLAGVGEERRLPDAAGDEGDMLVRQVRKTVAEGAPDFNRIARLHLC